MNIVVALPADRRGSHQSTVFYNRPLLLGPAFINSHSVCLVTGTCYCEVFFYALQRSTAICGDPRRSAGRATILPMTPRIGFYSRCSALCVMQVGAKFKHILELMFKQQIFMIFIVDYFCKKGFLKIEKNLIRGQSF